MIDPITPLALLSCCTSCDFGPMTRSTIRCHVSLADRCGMELTSRRTFIARSSFDLEHMPESGFDLQLCQPVGVSSSLQIRGHRGENRFSDTPPIEALG